MENTENQPINLIEIKKDLTFFSSELNKKIRVQNSRIKYFTILNGIVLILLIVLSLFIVKNMNYLNGDLPFKNPQLKRQK